MCVCFSFHNAEYIHVVNTCGLAVQMKESEQRPDKLTLKVMDS